MEAISKQMGPMANILIKLSQLVFQNNISLWLKCTRQKYVTGFLGHINVNAKQTCEERVLKQGAMCYSVLIPYFTYSSLLHLERKQRTTSLLERIEFNLFLFLFSQILRKLTSLEFDQTFGTHAPLWALIELES